MSYNIPKPNPNRSYPYLAFYRVSEQQYVKDCVDAGFSSWVPYNEIIAPKRQTRLSAGYDICTPVHVTLKPGERTLIPTGLKVKCDLPGKFLEIFIRSSVGTKLGVIIPTGACIIDADYFDNPKNEGHIWIPLYNISDDVVNIPFNTRIAQGIFKSYYIIDNDDASGNRAGGFGSTGKN